MKVAVPTARQITTLRPNLTVAVLDEYIDDNGHMNVQHYFDLHIRSTELFHEDIGIDHAYRVVRRLGAFTSEQAVRYHAEATVGQGLSLHPTVIARTDKAIHLMSFMLNTTTDELANCYEAVVVHVDLGTRRPTPLPDDIAERFDGFIARQNRLTWTTDLKPTLGLRRPSEAGGRIDGYGTAK